MFPLKDIKQALNLKIAMSQEMLEHIEVWHNSYTGNASWCDDKHNKSLGLEKAICREFANVVLNEMTANCTIPQLDEIFQRSIRRLNKYLQRGFATGALIAKPLGGNKVQYLGQNGFIPIEFDAEGKPIDVIFPDIKRLNNKVYRRMERHTLSPKSGLTIRNTAYVSDNISTLGREIPLTAVDEWADIQPYINYPMMMRMDFGYYVNPVDNTVDDSPCGMSLYDSALNVIELADRQFARLDWEFESGERAIHASEDVLKDGRLAKGSKRLYRAVESADEDTPINNLIQEYSPDFRQEDIIAGLEEYKRNIEFSVGLAYGDLSNPAQVEKTATEVAAARTRKFNTVTAIQDCLEEFLDDLIYALAFYNGMTKSGYKFSCTFKDSILADDEIDRKHDIQDMNNGIMRKEEYRAKWYGEDLETALGNLPESAQILE